MAMAGRWLSEDQAIREIMQLTGQSAGDAEDMQLRSVGANEQAISWVKDGVRYHVRHVISAHVGEVVARTEVPGFDPGTKIIRRKSLSPRELQYERGRLLHQFAKHPVNVKDLAGGVPGRSEAKPLKKQPGTKKSRQLFAAMHKEFGSKFPSKATVPDPEFVHRLKLPKDFELSQKQILRYRRSIEDGKFQWPPPDAQHPSDPAKK